MNETLAATLGELQAQIYWLHDAEEFAQLALAAATIYMKLGYTQQQAQTAGNLISQAYQLSDDAVLAQKAGDFDKEMQFYHQVKDKLTQVETTLDYQTSIAIHQMKWWMYFRHRDFQRIKYTNVNNDNHSIGGRKRLPTATSSFPFCSKFNDD
jgi:hypothetical protein